jgi:hypothetical protein
MLSKVKSAVIVTASVLAVAYRALGLRDVVCDKSKHRACQGFNPRPAVRPGDAPLSQPIDCLAARRQFARTLVSMQCRRKWPPYEQGLSC